MTPQPGMQTYGQPLSEIPTDGKATTSMVLGILSLVCFGILAGIPAVILGHMSRSNIRQSMGRLKGDGMALAGLIMGYISVAYTICMLFIIAAITIPNLLRAKMAANESTAQATVRTVSTAQIQYQATYSDVGYAPDLASLGGDPCNAATAEHACLIAGPIADLSCTANHWCVKSGYRFMVQADEKHPHESFVITAVPEEPDRSGAKNFCVGTDGIVRYERASSRRMTAYAPEECAALTPVE
jgi:hypothetical protein